MTIRGPGLSVVHSVVTMMMNDVSDGRPDCQDKYGLTKGTLALDRVTEAQRVNTDAFWVINFLTHMLAQSGLLCEDDTPHLPFLPALNCSEDVTLSWAPETQNASKCQYNTVANIHNSQFKSSSQ